MIFDMDGVLMNTEALHYAIWKEVFAECGLTIDFDHYKGCIGSNNTRLMQLIYEGYGVDFRNDDTIIQRFFQRKWEHVALHGVPPIEGVPQTLAQLKAEGYRIAVASSSPKKSIEVCLQSLDIHHFFEVLFSTEQVARPKPAPDVFLAAATALGADPGICTVVEDSRNGTLAAKAAGMHCIGFVNPDSGDQDLSAADVLIHRFGELLNLL